MPLHHFPQTPILIQSLTNPPKILNFLNIPLRLPYRIRPLRKSIKINVPLIPHLFQIPKTLQRQYRMDAPEHHSILRRQTRVPVVQLQPEKFVPHERNALGRVFAGHKTMPEIEREAHVGAVYLIDEEDGGTGGGDCEEARVFVGRFEFQGEFNVGKSVAAVLKCLHDHIPLLAMIHLKGIVVTIISTPNYHLVTPQLNRHLRCLLRQLNSLPPHLRIRVRHGPLLKPVMRVPQTNRPRF
mmetsp:Transcript_16440/g.20541  ORF Transcript_16440/g.20541 Transcript_16440/m.20541 type:complete len:240 (-) Transcript_16440:938-1657(-)